MHQSFPVKELPNGKHIYRDSGGTFSHQHPNQMWWCERHTSIEEAWLCYRRQAQEPAESDKTGSSN